MLSDAFASLGLRSTTVTPTPQTSSPKNNVKQGGQSHHEFFIHSQLLPLTIQLQKETRGRRYREIQGTLQEAVTALVSFQSEEWPPRQGASTVNNGNATNSKEEEEETVEFTTAASVTSELTTEETSSSSTSKPDPPPASKQPQLFFSQEEPQTRENIHDAVIATLEAFMAVLAHPATTTKACELALDGITRLVTKRYVSGNAGGQAEENTTNANTANTAASNMMLHRLLESVSKCGSETAVDLLQLAMVKTLRTILTCPKCGVHEASMLLALRTTFHVYLVTKSQTCKEAAKSALLDMLRVVFSRMEAYHAVTKNVQARREELDKNNAPRDPEASSEASEATPNTASFASQYHLDSYTLFRSLCKLSSKELHSDTTAEVPSNRLFNTQPPTDPFALHSKILALELILAAMEFCGPAFCQAEKFVYLVQHYLCVSLLKNCVSHHTQVAFLSQKIFLVLVRIINNTEEYRSLCFLSILTIDLTLFLYAFLSLYLLYRFQNSKAI
jgi:hypothetical protein